MAFETQKQSGFMIDPSFMEGYPYKNKYHNVGQLMTPYEGKKMGVGGDYGPPQGTTYYSLENPVYPYPLDKDFNDSICLHSMVGHCKIPKYPWTYIPGNYFAPQDNYPNMKKVKTRQGFNTYPLGTHPDFHMRGVYPFSEYTQKDYTQRSIQEKYGGRSKDDRTYGSSGNPETGMFLYRRLPVASGPDSPNSNYYPPFDNFY